MSSLAGKRHMGRVARAGCVLCRRLGLGESPAQVHHIREEQGASQRSSDWLTIPLCHEHHVGQSGIHGLGRKEFERRYKSTELDLLSETLDVVYGPIK